MYVRWLDEIEDFRFDVTHLPGARNPTGPPLRFGFADGDGPAAWTGNMDTVRRLRQDRRNCSIASIRRAIRRLHRAPGGPGRVEVRGAGAEERAACSASKLASAAGVHTKGAAASGRRGRRRAAGRSKWHAGEPEAQSSTKLRLRQLFAS